MLSIISTLPSSTRAKAILSVSEEEKRKIWEEEKMKAGSKYQPQAPTEETHSD